jgi:hypothetical protein
MNQDLVQGASADAAQASGHPGTEALKRRQPELENVELPLADKLINQLGLGIHVDRQVSCPGGRVDVLTPDDIFECKAEGDERSIFEAARQLRRYAPHFPGRALNVVVPIVHPEARWLMRAFRAVDIGIIQLDLEP